MSALLYEAASAADMVQSSHEQCAAMLRHHLYQAMLLAEELGMQVTGNDLCQILKWLDA
jgi:hypothetical protein